MRGSPSRPDTHLHRHTLPVRLVFAALGTLFLGLGVAGLFLPVLPTTPFLLLAAACYARSSRRIFDWLLSHAHFGPLIREWREHRAIPYRAKRIALVLIALSFAISLYRLFHPRLAGQAWNGHGRPGADGMDRAHSVAGCAQCPGMRRRCG